jgi:hypothetical protein
LIFQEEGMEMDIVACEEFRNETIRHDRNGGRVKRMAYGYRDSEFFFMKIKSVFPGNP